MAAGGGALAASVALAALAAMLWRRRAVRGAGRVCVAVLGDLGRSPRMQHHALSLARHGRGVSLLGYFQTRPHGDVLSSGEIRVVPLSELRCSRGLSHASTHSRKQPAASCEDIWPSQKPLKVFESSAAAPGQLLVWHGMLSVGSLVVPQSLPGFLEAVPDWGEQGREQSAPDRPGFVAEAHCQPHCLTVNA
ncbi:uncharacterized protein LOC128079068 isoform X3 [Tympanuchus pallidicinctus]|uniref:uncharacterized protein LOC128079068 isoform X3 n=1 Tax=Tympanuchus pallidicinctus TaxID=109042 RepID=UPI00228707D7|nr:uncharacterized protein LOC128079068 isoform X3 [Tympanuchus pallidicinctus]